MSRFPPGTSFLFVGKLESMTREQARAIVRSLGGVCPSGPVATLDYLVVGHDETSSSADKKAKQARVEALIEAGAPTAVIDEREFLELVELETGAAAIRSVL